LTNFPKLLFDSVPKLPNPRLRDWTGYYATDAGKDPRDLYWRQTGEPTTDPMDFKGCLTTSLGRWVEEGMKKDRLSHMGLFGYHLYASQVAVGETNPIPWQGYIDFMFYADKKFYVKELKTVWGKGADWIYNSKKPKDDHCLQLGLYLRDLHRKGKNVEEGTLTYFLFSSDPSVMGVIMEFAARYNESTNSIEFFELRLPSGSQSFSLNVGLDEVFKSWQYVSDCVAKKELPAVKNVYKYPVTPELIKELKDYQLIQAIEGDKIHGDWAIEYSSYKKKHLSLTRDKPFYSAEEIRLFQQEYTKRHPKHRRDF
jgi:hypothetical protein